VINDSWGRLPIYYWSSDGQFIITRNISYITQNIELEYDSEVLGMSILLGLTLGQDTMWKKVLKLPPHSIMTYDLNENKPSGGSFFDLNTVSGDYHLDELKDEIKDVFEESLKSRLDKMENPTLSLSGGLDSRLIAAAIKDIDSKVPFITYNRTNGVDKLDYVSSKQIIDQLGTKDQHEVIEIEETKLEDADELLAFKQGLNYLSMSYVLPYYKLHEKRNISTITGDGGGKWFVDLYPLKNLSSMKSLIGYILRYNAFCSIETAAAMANISPSVLKEKLIKTLKEYPFASYNDKYTFFLIREAGINWALEGEDRNRQYTWSSTPYYNPKLIRLCLAMPQRSKEYGMLYKYLYKQFPGNLENVSNPNWNEVVEDSKSVRRIHNKQKIKGFIPAFLLEKKKGISMNDFEFSNELQSIVKDWEHNDLLNLSTLKDKNSTNFYWQLFTLTKLMNSNN
jgi:asparagine synthase (glutamine-hydrolysing)